MLKIDGFDFLDIYMFGFRGEVLLLFGVVGCLIIILCVVGEGVFFIFVVGGEMFVVKLVVFGGGIIVELWDLFYVMFV